MIGWLRRAQRIRCRRAVLVVVTSFELRGSNLSDRAVKFALPCMHVSASARGSLDSPLDKVGRSVLRPCSLHMLG